MRLLSIVGLKTLGGRRATLVDSSHSTPRRFRTLSPRAQFLVLFICLFVGIFMQLQHYPAALFIQESVVNFLEPVSATLAKPSHWVERMREFFRLRSELVAENQSLKLQNDFLIRKHHNHTLIHSENLTLKKALNVKSLVTEDIVTARITHHLYDGYSTTYFITASLADGVKKNNPILSTSGHLLGRIIFAGEKKSRFMPITDVSSRVPVTIGASGTHAILVGTGKNEGTLSHIENHATIQVGDKLLTSGVGGIFTPGIPVAIVKSIEDTKVTVTPSIRSKDLDFVLVISQTQEEH